MGEIGNFRRDSALSKENRIAFPERIMQSTVCAVLIFLFYGAVLAKAEEKYPIPPESVRQEGVPAGVVTKGVFSESLIYPGTVRDYAIYVPAQYDAARGTALMIFQDGLGYLKDVPTVFDNMIHTGEIPPMIGLFVNPGVVPALNDESEARYNRSFEYDAADGRYARFLVEEMMPVALAGWNVSSDPNFRAICGSSSGGIAAFQAAWERPDQFRRVFTTVGTFVGLRGGHELPVLVRKVTPKPLRVFLQDGSNDNNLYCGSWWVANQDMLASLEWAGYEVNHAWGEGEHNRKHGSAIFPEVLRWLWQDWKGEGAVVKTHLDRSKSQANEFLVEGEEWQLVADGQGKIGGMAVDSEGELFFTDSVKGELLRLGSDGKIATLRKDTGGASSLAFAPGGKLLYASQPKVGQIVSWDLESGEERVLAKDVKADDLVVAHDGRAYFVESGERRIQTISPKGELAGGSGDFSGTDGIALSTDQSLLLVSDFSGRYVWSGQRKADGALLGVQPFFHLHVPSASVDVRSQASGMAVAKDGWLLVATVMGIQICDQPGRVHLIVPGPMDQLISKIVLDGHTLYAATGGMIYKRAMKLEGAPAWAAPVKPPKPRL